MVVKCRSILVACLALMAMVGLCFGDTVYVTTNGVGGGASWGAAASLSTALSTASSGDQLWLEEGTYAGSTFSVATPNLSLYGGFTNGMGALGERNWTNYPALLDGEYTRRVISITATNVVLDGVIVKKGRAGDHGSGLMKTGAGLLTLANCQVRENQETSAANYKYGVGAYFGGGTVIITNCQVVNNKPQGSQGSKGAGIYSSDTDVLIVDCLFTNNMKLANTFRHDGGAIGCDNGVLTVLDTDFIANRSHGGGVGSAIYMGDSASGSFVNCLFLKNQCTSYGASGRGTIYLGLGSGAKTVTVENCTFAHNAPGYYGGAFAVVSGSLVVRNSILWSNVASVAGNEIYHTGGNVTIDYTCITSLEDDEVWGAPVFSHTITNDPLFVSNTNLHLKSTTGRWDSATGQWTNDAVHSSCIDIGDASSDHSSEPEDNGNRLNLGRYGNTGQASKSPTAVGPVTTNKGATVYYTTAELRGELLSGTLSEVTIYYGTNATDLGSQNSVVVYPPPRTGTVFSADVVGLLPNELYYWACFATNTGGTNWSVTTNFTSAAAPPGGGSTIIHVDKHAAGAQDGTSWLDAYKTMAAAVAAVNAGTNEIWVAADTYNDGQELVIATNMAIYGGFATHAETTRSQRSFTNESILTGGYVHRVINITAADVVLDGVIIKKGRAGDHGSGIIKTGAGLLTLANCQLRESQETSAANSKYGVGAYFGGGTVIITNCQVENNKPQGGQNTRGAGIYSSGADVEIVDCLFTNNTKLPNAFRHDGGAIGIDDGVLTVRDTDFIANRSHGWGVGSAIYMGDSASGTIVNCLFLKNECTYYGVSGRGTIYLGLGSTAKTVTVENCTFAYNTPGYYGGAFYVSSGNLVVRNSIMWSNAVTEAANEIYHAGGNVTVDYSCMTGIGDDEVYGSPAITRTITNDPQFAGPLDLHLKSVSGRWDVAESVWTNDAVHSPCIDAGSPGSDYSKEPAYNGGLINLGRYGNTDQASKSPPPAPPTVENRSPTIYYTMVTLRGELTSGTLSQTTIYYGTNQTDLMSQSSVAVHPPAETGSIFSATVTGLLPEQQYYWACFVTNAAGANWAATTNVTTGSTPPGGGATIIHVDKDAPGTEDGTSWLDAFKSVGEAVAVVNSGTNEIWIAAELYNNGGQITIATNLSMYGGFRTGLETNRSERLLTNEVALTGEYVNRVINITAGNVVLDGITVKKGTSGDHGAGLMKMGTGTLYMANCHIRENREPANYKHGVGAYFGGGTVIITNCEVVNNWAKGSQNNKGIGFYAQDTDVLVVDCAFTNNTKLPNRFQSMGGAIFFKSGMLTVVNTDFIANTSHGNGNGSAISFGTDGVGTLRNCLFLKHRCFDYGASGWGTIYADLGSSAKTVTVENCTFTRSDTGYYGGALAVASGTLIVRNCIMWSNNVTTAGEEIYASGADSVVIVTYTDLTGTNSPYIDTADSATVNRGDGLLTVDPLFVGEMDLHLKSKFGRWIGPGEAGWTNDTVTSQCIDAGDPDSDYSMEPSENGGDINLGAYGNTVQASKSAPDAGTLFMLR